jgi:chemotaxis protein MotB
MTEENGSGDFDPAAASPEEDPPEEGAPLWALTFGDMMSLLLCFFVLMFSMSEVKVDKFLIAAESLRNGLGNGPSALLKDAGKGGSSVVDTDVMTSDPAPYDITIAMEDVDDFFELISRRLEAFVTENGLKPAVEVGRGENGVSLTIQEMVLFDTGSADLRPESAAVMAELGRIVAEFDTPVVVAGHTDDRPIHTLVFPSNWELSSARASVVARLIIEQGLPPEKIHVEGFAEFQPAAKNDTDDGRSKNRRVEILYTRDNVISELIENRKKELQGARGNETPEGGAQGKGKELTPALPEPGR